MPPFPYRSPASTLPPLSFAFYPRASLFLHPRASLFLHPRTSLFLHPRASATSLFLLRLGRVIKKVDHLLVPICLGKRPRMEPQGVCVLRAVSCVPDYTCIFQRPRTEPQGIYVLRLHPVRASAKVFTNINAHIWDTLSIFASAKVFTSLDCILYVQARIPIWTHAEIQIRRHREYI